MTHSDFYLLTGASDFLIFETTLDFFFFGAGFDLMVYTMLFNSLMASAWSRVLISESQPMADQMGGLSDISVAGDELGMAWSYAKVNRVKTFGLVVIISR